MCFLQNPVFFFFFFFFFLCVCVCFFPLFFHIFNLEKKSWENILTSTKIPQFCGFRYIYTDLEMEQESNLYFSMHFLIERIKIFLREKRHLPVLFRYTLMLLRIVYNLFHSGPEGNSEGFQTNPVWLKNSFSEILNWINFFYTVFTLINIRSPYSLP